MIDCLVPRDEDDEVDDKSREGQIVVTEKNRIQMYHWYQAILCVCSVAYSVAILEAANCSVFLPAPKIIIVSLQRRVFEGMTVMTIFLERSDQRLFHVSLDIESECILVTDLHDTNESLDTLHVSYITIFLSFLSTGNKEEAASSSMKSSSASLLLLLSFLLFFSLSFSFSHGHHQLHRNTCQT